MDRTNNQSKKTFKPTQIKRTNYAQIAKVITSIQKNSKFYCNTISECSLGELKSLTLGVTGAAGVGKSSFINKFTEIALQDDKNIAIIAIDPTSKYSLGTFLGDRLRFNADFPEAGVFIRSIASSTEINSIPHNLDIIIKFLKLIGYNMVIVETLGVGQSDVEIKNYVDFVIVIPSHESKNWEQQFKLGLHDIADFYFINKCDTINTDVTYNSLKDYLNIKGDNLLARDAIFRGSAKSGQGMKEIYSSILKNFENF